MGNATIQRHFSYGYTVNIYFQECINCGVVFGLPTDFDRELRRSRKTFYCPLGHPQSYIKGASEEDRLRARLDQEEAHARDLRDQLEAERRSKAAVKGHLTRALKRGKAGVCPVQGCKRHFENLARHVKTKHPEFAP